MKRNLFFHLKAYFGFSRRESKGFIMVIPALFILYSLPVVFDWQLRRGNQNLYAQYEQKVDSLIQLGWSPSTVGKGENSVKQDSSSKKKSPTTVRGSVLNKLDFNEADSVVLQIVPGIGQTMASRIVKFREGMGGLHDRDQLLDVYGMSPELIDRMFEYFAFSPGIQKKLDINLLEVSDLAKHPYITYGAAKVIVAYREQHGPYQKPEDLLKIKIFNENWLERLLPYLEF
ncbi:MAG: ComEA family DNA-binding protein [Cecembia sp.]